MYKAILVIVVVGSILGRTAFADHIILKNCDRLSGTIIKSDGESLSIQSEFAGEVTVQWAAIEEISSNQPLYVTLKGDQVIVGVVTTSEAKIEIQTREAGKVTISKDVIQSIRSQEEQVLYEAEINRLRNPSLRDFWGGIVDAGISSSRGNADTITLNLGMKAARTTQRDKISVYFTLLFAQNSTIGESVTTANVIRGGTRYDINVSDRLFTFGFTDLEFDEFQELDLRNVLGGGLGFHAKKTQKTVLDLFTGGAFNQELFSTGLTRRFGEILFGEELSYKLSSRTTLTEKLMLYPNLTQPGEYRIAFDSSAVTKLNNWLNWHVTLSDRFLSNPIPGVKKNDVLLTTGVGLKF